MDSLAVRRTPVRFGAFELDQGSGELRKGPTRLRVPDQSIQILQALLERPGDLVTRDELRQRLWPSDTFVDFEHGLNAAVRRLREALGDSADAPVFVETLPRRGYRFIGAVEAPPPESVERLTPESATRPGPDPPATSTRRRFWPLPLMFGALVVAIAATAFFIRRVDRTATPPLPARSLPVTSAPGVEADPGLSPDGSHVAFAWQREPGGNVDIYNKVVDSGETVQLTTDEAEERSPVWSPDGTRIAFLRATASGAAVYVVPPLGGSPREITQTSVPPLNGPSRSRGLSWTPDGRAIAVVDRSPSGNNWIVGCLVETGDRQSLTQPPNGLSDTGPAISPDGRYLAFVRTSPGYNMGQVFVQPIDGLRPVGAPTQLTQEHSTGTVAWTHDSATVVYERHGSGLWRIAVGGGTPEPLLTNVRAHGPSISRNGGRLAFQNTSTDANIWRLPGPAAWDRPGTTLAPQRIVASTLADMSPQVSPDGRSIAFMSEQSGSPEIWMSASDGSQAEKLTSISGAFLGSPRWSQDQRFVAFDSTQSGSFNIQVVGVADRRPRAVTTDTSGNIRPSWSRDGRSIYFTSTRTGEWQIWKVAAEGGRPTQVTKQGGYEAFESADGHLYYAKRPGTQGIWKVPVDGGPEVQVLERGRQISWALIDAGIVLLDGVGTPHPRIEFFAFESTRSTTRELPADVRLAPIRGPHFSVSRDGEWLAVVQNDNWGSDIYRIDGRW